MTDQTTRRSDFFIFGSGSEVIRALVAEERDWFTAHVRRFVLVQRSAEIDPVWRSFDVVVEQADAADPKAFRASLDRIVSTHCTGEAPVDVFPTYGTFNVHGDMKRLRFAFTDTGFQINLNSRLQVIDAFARMASRTRFHLFGSLLGSFPYIGDYAASMWYINQLPGHPEYADLDLRVYNLGGMKTRFWDHAAGPANNPFVHADIPTRWLRDRIASSERGVFDCYPTLTSRVAIALARRGLRLL
ncbi:MAG: hypothetical protein Q8O26_14855 [Phreatobacter sp.]|uniref:hypothetical protein n=1 Tax=Phreatobacter sp. TaxID=1966341 RepID=UPI0027342560|nr:hypothetical protein [Phreatobacter sp.]MDP2803153.1 hypothetical protein [Phreatobacter sp.]